jgi:hypothetical protein
LWVDANIQDLRLNDWVAGDLLGAFVLDASCTCPDYLCCASLHRFRLTPLLVFIIIDKKIDQAD